VEEGITWVGLGAHKAAANVAMFLPGATRPVEWQLCNDAVSVRRMARKIERQGSGRGALVLRSRPLRLQPAAADHGRRRGRELHGGRTGADPAQARQTDQNGPM